MKCNYVTSAGKDGTEKADSMFQFASLSFSYFTEEKRDGCQWEQCGAAGEITDI